MKVKRLLAIVLTLCMLLGTTAFSALAEETDTTISTPEDLVAFCEAVNGGNTYAGQTVTLAATIDLSTIADWTPIGNGSRSGSGYTGNAFSGTFDGGNNTISNLTISSGESSAAIGLFGVVDGGTVKNLTLTDVNINALSNKNAGAAIGLMVNNATADSITVSGAVSAADGVGGVIGRMTISGTVSNCVNSANVSGAAAGGIVGKAYYTGEGEMNISNCTNSGTITGTANGGAGGIVGFSTTNVSGCTNSGTITSSADGVNLGGIVGWQQMYGEISGNTNNGSVTSDNVATTAGGIVGWANYQYKTDGTAPEYPVYEVISVKGNTNNASVTAANSSLGSGGIVGGAYNAVSVTGNTNYARTITGSSFAAGILGNYQNSDANGYNGDAKTLTVTDNTTYTKIENITANCTNVVCYDNVFYSTNDYTLTNTVITETPVAKIGETGYASLADALAVASAMTGDVTVEIYDKVTLNQNLAGSWSTIKFVGKEENAEIYLEVEGYITATGKTVAFEDLKLSKSEGGYITNAGFMNVAFGVYDVNATLYTNCTFVNGAYASSGNTTFTGCTFYRSYDKYGLWAYGNVDCTVDGCTFADYRGIKMYAEGAAKTVDLTVKNTDFCAVDSKPAIVLTYGESVTLENNTYSSTGVFELDLDGSPNGTPVTSDVSVTCTNDNGACGVLVDGKIYTTVAQAAAVATEGSTVTLLYDSTETVELAEGVILDKNGFTAGGVTVKVLAVAKIGNMEYASFAEALANAGQTDTITLLAPVTVEAGEELNIHCHVVYVSDVLGESMFVNNGKLTIAQNGYIDYVYAGEADTTYSKGNYAVENRGELILDGGQIAVAVQDAIPMDKFSHALYAINNNGTASTTIISGNVTNYNGYAIRQVASSDSHINTVTINDGYVLGARAVWMQAASSNTSVAPTISLNVNGGTLEGYGEGNYTLSVYSYSYGNSMENISIDVTGGELIGDVALTGGANKSVAETLTITGGKITDVYSYATDDVAAETINISGGTFETAPKEEYLAEGYSLTQNADGTYGVKVASSGDIGRVYIDDDYYNSGKSAIFGEVTITATESLTIKLYSGETLVGTASLVDTDKVLLCGESRKVSWHIRANEEDNDSWWDTEWIVPLNVNALPDKAELWVDGVKAGEKNVELNGADSGRPVCAAVTDADGNVQSFISGDGWTYTSADYDEAMKTAIANGGYITLLRDIALTETLAVPADSTVTLDLNGFDIVGELTGITNNGTLTINDSVGTGNIYTTDVSAQGRPAIYNTGNLTINGGWFGDSNNDTTDRNAINRGNALKNAGTAVIKGGYFTNVSNQYIGTDAYAYAINTLAGGTTTINNATVYGDVNGIIYSEGTTIVEDGSYTLGRPNEENNLWYLAYGNVEIKGGTWTRAFAVPSWNTGDPTVYGNVEVSGGMFNVTIPETNLATGYTAIKELTNGYNVVGTTPTATVNNLGSMTIPAGEYYVYDGSLNTGNVDMPLNFVMQFVADQDAEDMETSPYADWYADFVITFEGIENGSFDSTGCYLAGYYGSTDSWDGMWVKIPVEGIISSIDEGTRYPVMIGVGMPQTYNYICSGVQAFSCAMFIPENILKDNPNLKVNLELNVVDSSDDSKALEALQTGNNIYKASETTYTAEDFAKPVAEIGETKYTSLQAAVDAATPGDTITVIADADDEAVSVNKNVTITGNTILNNVSIDAVTGCDELAVSGLTFTGNSWINSGAADKLTVSGVTANVTPSNAAYTNSRSGFISLGRSEQKQLELTVEGCNIISNGGADPIIGWAAITKADIKNNIFGSETAYQTNSDSAKFMAIADSAVFTISGNTVYSNYNGFVFGQNTTRDNAYTAVIENNTFIGGADHVWIEVSGAATAHAKILATSDNTVNGNAFTLADVKYLPSINTWTGYVGIDVVLDENGKITGGTFTSYSTALANYIAEGYEVKANEDGTYGVVEKAVTATPFKDSFLFVGDIDVETHNNADYYPVYVATSVDSLNYRKVGFKYTFTRVVDGTEKVTTYVSETKNVYNSISDATTTYTVEDIGGNGAHLYMDKLLFPASAYNNENTTITITPYAYDLNGNEITGWTFDMTNDAYKANTGKDMFKGAN